MAVKPESKSGSKPNKRPPRFARKRPDDRRRELIEAAIRCLGTGGLGAFTVERICKEATVSRGLLNHYFKSKDDLLVAVYEAMTDHLAEPSEEAIRAAPEAHIAEIIAKSFDPVSLDSGALKAWLTLWGEIATNPALLALHRSRYRSYRGGLSLAFSVLAEARGRAAVPEDLAVQLIALIDGLWLEWGIDPSAVTAERSIAGCYRFLEGELGPLERRGAPKS